MFFDIKEVSTGQVKFGRGNVILSSNAIGSCVVIAVLSLLPEPMGILAHVMLPGKSLEKGRLQKTKYAHDAIDKIMQIMKRRKICRDDARIFLAGGGNVLERTDEIVCKLNIASIKELLAEKGFRITAETLGGTSRRSFRLDIANGNVYYTKGNKKEKLLWSLKDAI